MWRQSSSFDCRTQLIARLSQKVHTAGHVDDIYARIQKHIEDEQSRPNLKGSVEGFGVRKKMWYLSRSIAQFATPKNAK